MFNSASVQYKILISIILLGLENLFFDTVHAQSYHTNVLNFEVRSDYEHSLNPSIEDSGNYSLRYLNLAYKGSLGNKLSLNYRQRMNMSHVNITTFTQGTDWLYFTYKPVQNLSLSAGKQVVAIGGFEYDESPVDTYIWSNFWNSVVCYEMGTTITYTGKSQKNSLGFQFSNSPFRKISDQTIFAYNLIWQGNNRHFNTIYSANAVEYEKDKYIYYLALGNKIHYEKFSIYIDWMNRFDRTKNFLLKDFSIMGEIKYHVTDKWTVFSKNGFDLNNAQSALTQPFDQIDRFVLPGTHYTFSSIGTEYYPLTRQNKIRIHGLAGLKKNQNNTTYVFDLGATWRFDFLKNNLKQP